MLQKRKGFSNKTKRGLPIILAGVLFWIVMSITDLFFLKTSGVGIFNRYGLCVSFWLNDSAILKIDMFAKGNPLGFWQA